MHTFIAGGATAKYVSPLWYVMDSSPTINAPSMGLGTKEWISFHKEEIIQTQNLTCASFCTMHM